MKHIFRVRKAIESINGTSFAYAFVDVLQIYVIKYSKCNYLNLHCFLFTIHGIFNRLISSNVPFSSNSCSTLKKTVDFMSCKSKLKKMISSNGFILFDKIFNISIIKVLRASSILRIDFSENPENKIVTC